MQECQSLSTPQQSTTQSDPVLSKRKKLRYKVAIRFSWRCYWCSQSLCQDVGYMNSATIEHFKPRCQGRTSGMYNLAAACWRCNNKRGHQSHEDFALQSCDFLPDQRLVSEFSYKNRRERWDRAIAEIVAKNSALSAAQQPMPATSQTTVF